jgi:hypothetical protein
MHRNVIIGVVGVVYYVLSCFALSIFEAGILSTALILFALPAYVLARYSEAPGNVIISVLTLGTGIAFILEGIAHIYGIWYAVGVDELRIFGLIPVEMLFASIIQTLFLCLLYELIFDDGVYTEKQPHVRFAAFGIFAVSVLALVGIHQYLLNGIFFTHSYVWILGILVASSLAALAVNRALTIRFFDRIALFTVVAFLPLCANLILAVVNNHKIFAYVNDYLYTFTIAGNSVPLEEIVLAFVMPFFVATFYELYLDDAR